MSLPTAAPDVLTLAEAARIMREAVRDKSYQLTPVGAEVAGYLRVKRKRLTDSSYRDYESGLDNALGLGWWDVWSEAEFPEVHERLAA